MKNIKMGNNVYKDIDRVCFQDENGETVTFVDRTIFDNKYACARFVSILHGNAFAFNTVVVNRKTATAKITLEV